MSLPWAQQAQQALGLGPPAFPVAAEARTPHPGIQWEPQMTLLRYLVLSNRNSDAQE